MAGGKQKERISERDIALDILLDMERNGTLSSRALEDGLRKIQFEDKECRAFVSRLVEGTTEYRLQLDAVLDHYAKVPVKKQKPKVRCILRMSVYQLLYMDRVPDRAVLSEAGRMMRAHHFEGLSGVVNGILRSVQRGIEAGEVQALIEGSRELKFSTPAWLVDRLTEEYGEERSDRILASSFQERPLTIRCNMKKQSPEELAAFLKEKGVEAGPGALGAAALTIPSIDFVRRLPGYREGRFSVQDESSMLLVEALGIKEGIRLLDVCAAPGGKSCYAAELGALVTSRDISEEKTQRIMENAERLGLDITAEVRDATEENREDFEKYDMVLADVPCSGLGVMGRKNDIKYHASPESVTELAKLGQEILRCAAKYVRPGGKLMFSTCTILAEENQEAAEHFLAEHPEYRKAEEKQFLQGIDPCDGFYYCLMIRGDSLTETPD